MKVFEWVPNKSIGDLKFNMSRDEARKAMGDAKYLPPYKGSDDIYADDRLRLGYDHDGLLESVVFLGNDKGFFEVHYKGKVIYPKYEKHFFRIFDKNIFKSYEESTYQSNELNGCLSWNKDIGHSFCVGREGYCDKFDEQQLLINLYQKLKQGMSRDETRRIFKEKIDKLVVRGQTDIYSDFLFVEFDDDNRMVFADWNCF